MNEVEFEVVDAYAEAFDAVIPRVEIAVDGVPLVELARRVELPLATADGQPSVAGGYTGLTRLEAVCWPSRHFLGSPELYWFDDGDTVLLGCTCTEWGCWPLCARVEVSETVVSWSDFRNGHREQWDLSALGPFEFDRADYEAALRRTERV